MILGKNWFLPFNPNLSQNLEMRASFSYFWLFLRLYMKNLLFSNLVVKSDSNKFLAQNVTFKTYFYGVVKYAR